MPAGRMPDKAIRLLADGCGRTDPAGVGTRNAYPATCCHWGASLRNAGREGFPGRAPDNGGTAAPNGPF